MIFQSSLLIAEDEEEKKTINSSKTIVNKYLEEDTANQLNRSLDTLDDYYDQLNRKLKKDTVNKPVNDVRKLEEVSVQADKSLDENIIDANLLDLMKTAGVDKKLKSSDKNEKKEPVVQVFRDPFALTSTLTGGERLIEDSLPFAQKSFAGQLPKMVLKGVVKKVDGTRVALIQLDDKLTYMVKENDRISLSALGLKSVIHIQEIHENSIIVEPGEINSGQENEVIVVR